MLRSLTEQTRAEVIRGGSLAEARETVNLDAFRDAMAGDSQMKRILFSYYVLTPAVQRACELISGN